MRTGPVAHSFCQNCVRDAARAGTIDRHTPVSYTHLAEVLFVLRRELEIEGATDELSRE